MSNNSQSKGIKSRQRVHDQANMKQQLKRVSKAVSSGAISFENQSFDIGSVQELLFDLNNNANDPFVAQEEPAVKDQNTSNSGSMPTHKRLNLIGQSSSNLSYQAYANAVERTNTGELVKSMNKTDKKQAEKLNAIKKRVQAAQPRDKERDSFFEIDTFAEKHKFPGVSYINSMTKQTVGKADKAVQELFQKRNLKLQNNQSTKGQSVAIYTSDNTIKALPLQSQSCIQSQQQSAQKQQKLSSAPLAVQNKISVGILKPLQEEINESSTSSLYTEDITEKSEAQEQTSRNIDDADSLLENSALMKGDLMSSHKSCDDQLSEVQVKEHHQPLLDDRSKLKDKSQLEIQKQVLSERLIKAKQPQRDSSSNSAAIQALKVAVQNRNQQKHQITFNETRISPDKALDMVYSELLTDPTAAGKGAVKEAPPAQMISYTDESNQCDCQRKFKKHLGQHSLQNCVFNDKQPEQQNYYKNSAYDNNNPIDSPKFNADLPQDSRMSKGFEANLGGALNLDEKEDEIDMKLIRRKTRQQNQRMSFSLNNGAMKTGTNLVGTGVGVRDQQKMPSKFIRQPSINHRIRKAITLFRNKLNSQEDKPEGSASNQVSDILNKNKVQAADSELARLIEQTYRFIYRVENKEVQRKIFKIEDLFDSNPLEFDDCEVNHQLIRRKKQKKDDEQLKSSVKYYFQQMKESRQQRKFLKAIIQKYQINVKKKKIRPEGEQHTMNCYDNSTAFLSYKADKFFNKDTTAKRKPKEAINLIKYVIEELTRAEELHLLGKYILQYLPPKNQKIFLAKIQGIIKVNFEDPAVTVLVEKSQYEQKNAASSSNGASPRTSLSSPPQSPASIGRFNSPRSPKLGSPPQSPLRSAQSPKSMSSASASVNRYKDKTNLKKGTMVQAYNFQYILAKIDNTEDKNKIVSLLEKYLQAQLKTMPRTIDEDNQEKERFANLQRLLNLTLDLHNKVKWADKIDNRDEKTKKRDEIEIMKKELHEIAVKSRDQLQRTQTSYVQQMHHGQSQFRKLTLEDIDESNGSPCGRDLKQAKTQKDDASSFLQIQSNDLLSKSNRRNNSSALGATAASKVSFIGVNKNQSSPRKTNVSFSSPKGSPKGSPKLKEDSVFSYSNLINLQQTDPIKSGGEAGGSLSKHSGSLHNNSGIRGVISQLAKETLKRMVPKQVYIDCADTINKALSVSFKNNSNSPLSAKDKLIQRQKNKASHRSQQLSFDHRSSQRDHRVEGTAATTQMNSSFYQQSSSAIPSTVRNNQNSNSTIMKKSAFSRMTRPRDYPMTPPTEPAKLTGQKHLLQNRVSSQQASRQRNNRLSQSQMAFFPNVSQQSNFGASRLSTDVKYRSQQGLRQLNSRIMRNSSTTQSAEFQSTRPKFHKSVAELVSSSENKNMILNKIRIVSQKLMNIDVLGMGRVYSSSGHSGSPLERRSSISLAMAHKKMIQDDKKKLQQLITLCMNDEYAKANQEENERKLKRNKATFKRAASSSHDIDPQLGDQAGLAFRKSANKALKADQVMYKKMDLNRYVEDIREAANKELYDFIEGIEYNTAPKTIKLLYHYFVGSRNLMGEMQQESVESYLKDQMMPNRPDLRQTITRKGKGAGGGKAKGP